MFLAALSVVVFIIRRNLAPAGSGGSTAATAVPFFRISNLAGAVFDSKVEGGAVRSSMTQGVAAFYVKPLGPGQSFLLTLPDGEIEVRGTRFVVNIDGGKTQGVDVAEGLVALRLRGRSEMLLRAGQRWPDAGVRRPMIEFLPAPSRSSPSAKPSEPTTPND
jgi:hypothetical protein